jgi:lipopolysaccharide export system permease protein
MILRRYILRELLAGVAVSFAALTLVLFLMNLFALTRSFPVMSLSFFARSAPSVLVFTVPMTLLVGVTVGMTLGYGRLAGDNEIDAMRVSGVRMFWILAPAVQISSAVAAVTLLLYWEVTPRAARVQRDLKDDVIVELLKAPPPGPQQLSIGQGTKMSYREARDGVFRDFRLHVFAAEKEGAQEIHSAAEARILFEASGPVVAMLECRSVKLDREGNRLSEQMAEEARLPLGLPGNEPDGSFRSRDLTGWQLVRASRNRANRVDLHTRLSDSLMPIALGLLAALIGIRVRRANRLAGLGASLPPLILYFVFTTPLKEMATGGAIDPRLAAYLPLAALAGLNAVLYWRATR